MQKLYGLCEEPKGIYTMCECLSTLW